MSSIRIGTRHRSLVKIKFQDGAFVSNKESEDGIIFDMGKKGIILGIEILGASQRLKPKDLSHFDIQIPFSAKSIA